MQQPPPLGSNAVTKSVTIIGNVLFAGASTLRINAKLFEIVLVSRARRGEQGRASQTIGAPGRTRTDNIQLRRLALYPVELRARDLGEHCNIFCYTSRLAQA